MKRECPNCNKNFERKFLKSIKTNGNIKGPVFICPHCESKFTVNTHKSEIKYRIIAFVMIVAFFGAIAIKEEWVLYSMMVVAAFSIVQIIRNEMVTLKEWPRWKMLNEKEL